MSVIDLTGVSLQALNEARKRSEMIDSIYRTGTIIGLGTVFYMGWWLYDFFTNAQTSIRNALGEVVEQDFPAVNPYLASDEAAVDYAAALGLPVSEVPHPSPAQSQADAFVSKFEDFFGIPRAESPEFRLLVNFRDAQRFVDAETGAVRGFTPSYYTLKKVEALLVARGYMTMEESPPMHPVDRVCGFVVHDKWYWGGVLGAAAVPMVTLGLHTLADISKGAVKDYEGR